MSPFFSLLSFLRKWSLFHHGPGSSWFRLGFRCLSPFCFLLAFLRSDFVVFPGSGWGSGACLPSSFFFLFFGNGFCSSMISWFLLVPARVPVLVSLLLSGRGFCSILISWFLLVPAWVPVLMSLLLPSFHFLRKTVLFRHDCMVPFLLRLLVFLFRFHL